MMKREMGLGTWIGIGVGALIALFVFFSFMGVIKLEGNEVGVVQDWDGVKNTILLPGTHFYNNFFEDVYAYNIGTQKITFDDMKSNNESEYPRILLDVGEGGGQKVWVAMSVNYRVNPDKMVLLHKQGLGKTYEQVILKREIIDVVNEIARPRTALSIYSGAGFVDFKNAIEKSLKENHVLQDRGLDIENTILYKVYLDPAYENEIAQKQIAQQQVLRKQEETKAQQEEAKRVFAQGQSVVEKAKQDSEALKVTQITNAEANARQEVLKAEAEKQKRVLEAEGNRDANLAMASGILAVGKAEAEVAQLKTNSLYAGESGSRRASVEIASLTAEKLKGMFSGVYIIPEKTIFNAGKQLGLNVDSQ